MLCQLPLHEPLDNGLETNHNGFNPSLFQTASPTPRGPTRQCPSQRPKEQDRRDFGGIPLFLGFLGLLFPQTTPFTRGKKKCRSMARGSRM